MAPQALALVPTSPTLSIAEVKSMATDVAKSGLFKGISSPESAFTLMLLCQAEGLHPIQALRRYHIIEGVPSMRAEAMLADFMKAGGKIEWKTSDAKSCTAVFDAPGLSSPQTVTWTIEDAQRAELTSKPNWRRYPRQMLRARVTTEGIRLAMPEIVVGIYSSEEVEDFVDDKRPAYTPPAARPATVNTTPITDASVEAIVDGTPVAPPAPPADLDPATVKRVQTVISNLALGKAEAERRGLKGSDREEYIRTCKLSWISRQIGRSVDSTRGLTPDEAELVIANAEAQANGQDVGGAA